MPGRKQANSQHIFHPCQRLFQLSNELRLKKVFSAESKGPCFFTHALRATGHRGLPVYMTQETANLLRSFAVLFNSQTAEVRSDSSSKCTNFDVQTPNKQATNRFLEKNFTANTTAPQQTFEQFLAPGQNTCEM
jgi:hypothetical protein